MADTNDFLEWACDAGLGECNVEDTAKALNISAVYARQLRSGQHSIRAPIRAKLAALIAAKANGPVDQAIIDEADDSVEPSPTSTASREQFDVDIPAPKRPMTAGGISSPVRRYEVVSTPTGEIKIAEILADCKVWSQAQRVCDLLNKEGD